MYEKFVDLLVDELQIDRNEITMDSELSGDLGINSIELADLPPLFRIINRNPPGEIRARL